MASDHHGSSPAEPSFDIRFGAPHSSSGGSWAGGPLESPDRAAVEALRQAVREGGPVAAAPLSGRERQLAGLARGRAIMHANREARLAEIQAARALAAEQAVAGLEGYSLPAASYVAGAARHRG